MTVRLSEEPRHGHANATVLESGAGTIVVDTLAVPSQWGPFSVMAQEDSGPVHKVVLTSSHFQFSGGAVAFRSAARYATRHVSSLLDLPVTAGVLRRLHPTLADEIPDDVPFAGVTHVVHSSCRLDEDVHLIPVDAQQRGNLVVLLPDRGVAIAGATAAFGVTPNAFDGDPLAWAEHAAALADMADVIVPGLGHVGAPEDALALSAYLFACVEADGDPERIPRGPWDTWTDRDLDEVNVERAALLARGEDRVPSSMLRRLGIG